LAVFFGLGIVATGLLVLVKTGDWLLASLLFILGRIGFTAANVFYDALLPHVAREEDRDSVSTRGYAMGYLGGGLLLAINVVMIQQLPGTLGPRLSFLSVAIWWAVFSIPLFLRVPEPPAATAKLGSAWNIMKVSFRRLKNTLKDIQQYRELFKYLVAFLIYIDGVGTIIGVAAIYGAELGFGSVELLLALLLVQFVGIPYSLIFGRLPSRDEKRRPFYLAFVLFNIVALPLGGILGSRSLPRGVTGMPPAPFKSTSTGVGQGVYLATNSSIAYSGAWETIAIPAEQLGSKSSADYRTTSEPGARFNIHFFGQQTKIVYSVGPDHGIWAVTIDGKPVIDEQTGQPVTIDAYNPTVRYGVSQTFSADTPGEHTLTVTNTGEKNPESGGTLMAIAEVEILPPVRQSNLGIIIALVAGIELVGLILALIFGSRLFSGMARNVDTKRGILLALIIYTVIAIWGFFLNSVIEFWFLAWMVAVVQGGSQALSRSLFANMSPASKSGEFFGLFGIMEKFSAILGPLVFAYAATQFGSSRPAVLSIIAFFIIGGYLLTRVNVEEGRRVARAEDAALLGSGSEV
jgi:MFS-type transporter involved in bile tolerance (Atg22 family)